jgi:hypothetical protein
MAPIPELSSVASLISGIGFILYGIQCLRSPFMRSEFERFGQARFRILTGWLEILGGAGVLVGMRFSPLAVFSASGLAILMAMGVAVRIRIGDRPLQFAPALFFCVLNALVVWLQLRFALAVG